MKEDAKDFDKTAPLMKVTAPVETQLVVPDERRVARYLAADHYGYGGSEMADRLMLSEIWRRIYKHKWLIATIVIIVTSIVVIESYRTKSLYRATATIEIAPETRTLIRSGDTVIETEETDSLYWISATMKTKVRLLQSRPLLEDVVEALRLDQNPAFLDVTTRKGVKESVQTIFNRVSQGETALAPLVPAEAPPLSPIEARLARSAAESARLSPYVDVLAANLTAAPVEDTRMLTISFQHTSPLLAAQVANTIAEVFIERSYKNKTQRVNAASSWLNTHTRELKAKVEEAEQKLADFSSHNNVTNLAGAESEDGKGSLLTAKLGKLHTQATQAETERILKQSLYEEVRQGRVAQLPEAFGDARLTALQAKLSELAITSAQNVGRFGPDNPRTIDVQKQMAALQKQVDEGRTTLAEKLKADYERAQRDEKALKAALETALNSARAEAIQQNYAAVQFSLLKQEVETAKRLYADFLQKTTQANMQVAEQSNNLQVIEPAQLPRTPFGPNRQRFILVGILLSLCFGVGLALVIEYMDDTLKTTEDIARQLGLPTLAVIPAVRARRPRAALAQPQSEPAALPADTTSQALQPAPRTKPLTDKNRSILVEAYRSLRASIMLSTAGNPPKTILFTSSLPGEGKTTTTANTAISLARLGLSVLVIDADMRRPSIYQTFGVDRSQGLSTYLSRDTELDKLIQNTSVPNVSVISSGAIPPNPTELLSSEKMKGLLQILSQRYDHILIDSPPLLSVTDSLILATLAEGVILIVQSGSSRRHLVRRARRELTQVGAKIFGVVLNNVDVRGAGLGEYEYGYYGYGSEEQKTEVAGS